MANKVEEEELCWGKILEELMDLLLETDLPLSEAALELLLIVYVMKNISTLLTVCVINLRVVDCDSQEPVSPGD